MVHGLVGILRKAQVVADEPMISPEAGPMSSAILIAGNLEDHLDKLISGIVEN